MDGSTWLVKALETGAVSGRADLGHLHRPGLGPEAAADRPGVLVGVDVACVVDVDSEPTCHILYMYMHSLRNQRSLAYYSLLLSQRKRR